MDEGITKKSEWNAYGDCCTTGGSVKAVHILPSDAMHTSNGTVIVSQVLKTPHQPIAFCQNA